MCLRTSFGIMEIEKIVRDSYVMVENQLEFDGDLFEKSYNEKKAKEQKELNRRKPGQSKLTTTRSEPDIPETLSGVFNNKTTGAPICLIIKKHII